MTTTSKRIGEIDWIKELTQLEICEYERERQILEMLFMHADSFA
jgi:hypothetical protein